MRNKNLRTFFTLISAFVILICFSKQLNATNYLIVYMDSVAYNDTIYTCNAYDSIQFISNTNCIEFWRVGYTNDYSREDTLYTETISLPGNFNGSVSYQGFVAGEYCHNSINVRPLILLAENKSGTCGSFVELDASTNYSGTDSTIYNWAPTAGLSDPNIQNPVLKMQGDMNYTVTLTLPNGCVVSKNIDVTLQPQNSPSICLVSVNENNYNVIYWEKPDSISIDSIYIYKETNVTNNYEKIGATGYHEANMFVDTASTPFIKSNKYKISFKDSCNFESEKSLAHKTIHLAINQGLNNSWNLIWEPYEGFEVASYYIYRGTATDNLQLIGATSGSGSQYTDFTAPAGNIYYQIEIVGPNACNYAELKSTQSVINTSRSNIATNNPTGLEKNIDHLDLFNIYPNPFNERIIIESKYHDFKDGIIEITDLTGKRIKVLDIKSDKIEINTNDLDVGLYILRIKTEKAVISKKVFKN
jgi:hypothetical protein